METRITGTKDNPKVIVIPKIRRSSFKYTLLCILAESEREILKVQELAELTGKTLAQIHQAALGLKRDGLIFKWREYVKVLPATKWYAQEYEVLEKTVWKR